MRTSLVSRLVTVALLFCSFQLRAEDALRAPAFSASAAALRQAAQSVPVAKRSAASILLNELNFKFEKDGRLTETRHMIYRVENEEGVKNWDEISGRWEAWYQKRPDLRARVISADGSEHWLDPKTLTDVPVHADSPETYSDARRYAGPLPAIAVGAIVEQEVVLQDSKPQFAAGTVDRWYIGGTIPIAKTHIVISHPESLPLRYELKLLPNAVVTKTNGDGVETVTIDQGALDGLPEKPEWVPPEVLMFPQLELSTGRSWHDVAVEYARVSEEKLRAADVQPLVAGMVTKNRSRADIIQQAVIALHKNVRYTGVEFGESSIIPQFPSEVLKRKYGDCKDKASLLVTMLRGEGIPATLALLNSGQGPDLNPSLPGFGMFDHAIVYVPAAGPDPELWIDATAQYARVGTLPWMDYGRWALVVGNGDDPLKRTPELTADQEVHRETREFTLAEYGDATIVEKNELVGPSEADYRDYYSGDSKKIREASETYVKEMYLADSLGSFEHSDLSDLSKPATITFTAKGRRGTTDLNSAVMAIRVENLFENLPDYFKTKEQAKEESGDDTEKTAPRTVDWMLWPFITEWHYKVMAPIGYKLRALPPEKVEKFNGVSFTQKYSANAAGTVVDAVLRVENTNSRLTVEKAKELRDAVVKARNEDPIFITFDLAGHELISAGKIKEGLAAYAALVEAHPKEALHKVQQADALLLVGLGEEARAAATEATKLDPNSAMAFGALGSVLEHDLIGRVLEKGMDYEGAVAAFKKAIALDPKDKDTRAKLALLLEYDSDGTRYANPARLKQAVAEITGLKKVDEEFSRKYDDNALYDLWYAHEPQQLLEYVAQMSPTDSEKGLTLASVALTQGTDAALRKSKEITTDDSARSTALVNAGTLLVRVRKYPEGAALLSEGARGQQNESARMRSAALFGRTKRSEEIKIDEADPRSAVLKLFMKMMSGKLTLSEMKEMTYWTPGAELPNDKEFEEMMTSFRGEISGVDLPRAVIADLALSNMRLTVDGDDSLGYKITVEAAGAAAQNVYVVKDQGVYKIAAFAGSEKANPEELGGLALQALDKNNLAGARKWLDRAREEIKIMGGEDPLSGSPFPYFWTQGQEADAATTRTAALVLLPSKQLKGQYLVALKEARSAAKTDMERNRLTMALAYAYSAQEQWTEVLGAAEELMNALPNSFRAFSFATIAYLRLNRLDDYDRLVQQRMHDHPDELEYTRSAAHLASYRGQFEKSQAILRSLIDKGQATSDDLNSYAWDAMSLDKPIDQDAIETAQRASELTKNADFNILHTLACLYARLGKTSEARELLLKAINVRHLEEPSSEIWFGLGLIAEQYGVSDAAQKLYERVEKPKFDYPGTSYQLALQRLKDMQEVAKSKSAKAGQ